MEQFADDITKLLSGPGYFDCRKLRCRLRLGICIGRQAANASREPFQPMPFIECDGCPQGLEISANQSGDKFSKGEKGKPRRGEGARQLTCSLYEECLKRAATKGWKSFHCEICPYFGEGRMTGENSELCRRCGERPPIQPKMPYCPVCMAELRKEKRASKNTATEGKQPPVKGKDRSGPRKSILGQISTPDLRRGDREGKETTLTIDFGDHVAILKRIEDLAREEFRPLDLQVIYMLNKQLDNSAG